MREPSVEKEGDMDGGWGDHDLCVWNFPMSLWEMVVIAAARRLCVAKRSTPAAVSSMPSTLSLCSLSMTATKRKRFTNIDPLYSLRCRCQWRRSSSSSSSQDKAKAIAAAMPVFEPLSRSLMKAMPQRKGAA